MSNTRILELAKELGVDVAQVQRAAIECGVSVGGPTTVLNDEDRRKITTHLRSHDDAHRGGKTLTLNRPMVAGQQRGGGGDHRSRTVQVEVRRRRHGAPETPHVPQPTLSPKAAEPGAVAPVEPVKTIEEAAAVQAAPVAPAAPASAPTPVPPAAPTAAAAPSADARAQVRRGPDSPAQRAARALEERKQESERARQAARETRDRDRREGRERTGGGSPLASRPQGDRPQGTRPQGDRPQGTRPQGDRPQGMRPQGDRPQGDRARQPEAQQGAGGPRTTIRRGLTPAQIAAAKAPRSSLKQIEERISTDRNERRKEQRAARPQGAAAPGGTTSVGPRRSPSVAVAPQVPLEIPGEGQSRKKTGPAPLATRNEKRLSPAEKAARRQYSEARHLSLTEEQEERMVRLARGGSRKKFGIDKHDEDFVKREVEIPEVIGVGELANRMAIKSAQVIKRLFEMGMGVTVNESIDAETASLIVEEFGHAPKIINAAAVEDVLVEQVQEETDEELKPRPPVVVVMGHVDHGKTSILDAIRKAHVAAGEAGGITQHIGAYMVKLEDGSRVVFVDTPGHEAFTSLRARGASLTDVAVLVVAADDGVMPQTIEALNHAKAAGVPIVVAMNKMDKPEANPDRIKQQLSEYGIQPEEWGGDNIFVPVSARTGAGLPQLLEMLALQTEVLELRANPTRRGRGVVIESRLDKGRGPVATVLVQNGTFHKGDIVVVGGVMGRIRAIVDENSVQHRTAGPSIPFELLGLEEVPEAGQEIVVVETERQAREIVTYRKDKMREAGAQQYRRATMDELFATAKGEAAKEVNVLIKGDVTGSLEAMADSLAKAGTDEVQVRVIHKGIGGITESDVMLASASGAIIIGFNVRPETKAKRMAETEGVDVRFYRVIYEAIDDIKKAMAGVLSPEQVEKAIGRAEVRETFSVPKVGTIAGTYMIDGYAVRSASVRVLRNSVVVFEGKLASLKRFKDDVREVKAGYECGLGIDKFNDVKVGDILEFFVIEEVAATL